MKTPKIDQKWLSSDVLRQFFAEYGKITKYSKSAYQIASEKNAEQNSETKVEKGFALLTTNHDQITSWSLKYRYCQLNDLSILLCRMEKG